jgi:hypothetical protein
MTQELLGRVHRELLDVLNSINQDKIHHDGDDFHELLNDVEKALAQPEQEPVIGKWSLREVYFDEDGEPTMHRSPPQRTEQELKRMGIIYYKNDACQAKDAYAHDCICWTKPKPEQNFCPRCGKRTNDIHTCTPPQENT